HPPPKNFPPNAMQRKVISGIRPSFPGLSQSRGQVTHVLLTRSPLVYPRKGLTVRLACVKHAASVRPEPGSNSPTKTLTKQKNTTGTKPEKNKLDTLLSSQKTPAHHHQPQAVSSGAVRDRCPVDDEKVTRGLDNTSNRPPATALTCDDGPNAVTYRGCGPAACAQRSAARAAVSSRVQSSDLGYRAFAAGRPRACPKTWPRSGAGRVRRRPRR